MGHIGGGHFSRKAGISFACHAGRRALESRGIRAWADSQQLVGGDALEPKVLQAIAQATHVLAILSLAAVHSAWVRKEVQQSLKAGKPMIPVLLPVCWGYGSKRKRTESAVTGNLSCLPD